MDRACEVDFEDHQPDLLSCYPNLDSQKMMTFSPILLAYKAVKKGEKNSLKTRTIVITEIVFFKGHHCS